MSRTETAFDFHVEQPAYANQDYYWLAQQSSFNQNAGVSSLLSGTEPCAREISAAFNMILLLDNYDSFVFNLDRYLQQLGQSTIVVRSDSITVDSIEKSNFDAIVISPGPKSPDEAGCSLEVIRRLHHRMPILGVCLGHQCIVQAFGGMIVRCPRPMHGVHSHATLQKSRLFDQLGNLLRVGRYHSLMAAPDSIPTCLRVTATSDDGVIMAVEHCTYPVFGVQFHPESILTNHGHQLLANFLSVAGLVYDHHEITSDLERMDTL